MPNETDSERDTHPCESSVKSTKRKQIADEVPSSNVRKSLNEMSGMTSSERANMTSTERVYTASSAYLNGIYEPKGFDDGTGHVYHLIKSLYSLSQAGHEWNDKLNKQLESQVG